jgi:hypothetical protein
MLMLQAKKNRDHRGKRLIIQAVSLADSLSPATRLASSQVEPVKCADPTFARAANTGQPHAAVRMAEKLVYCGQLIIKISYLVGRYTY